MVPILHGTDLTQLRRVAGEIARRMIGRTIVPGDVGLGSAATPSPLQKSTCRHYCTEELSFSLQLCNQQSQACNEAVLADAVQCENACTATGGDIGSCLANCATAQAAGLSVCSLNQVLCRQNAIFQRTSCIAQCPLIHP